MVRLEDVSKSYGQTSVVTGVNLQVKAGETLAIIGSSGCGKTTLLKMINRLISSSSGRILVKGVDIAGVDPVKLRREIGYVIQQVGLLPHLTVRDNITFVLQLMDAPKAQQTAKAEELIQLVGLPLEYLEKRPHQLSGGQQQRVGVARSLAADPAVILMDEPFGAVDPITRQQLQEMVIQLQRKMMKTILFVTHDIQEAFKLGTQIAVMKEGRIVKVGTPLDLIREQDAFVQELLGRRSVLYFLENIPVRSVLDVTVPILQVGQNVSAVTGPWESIIVVDAERRFLGVLDKQLCLSHGGICIAADILSGGLTVEPDISVSSAIETMLWQGGHCWLPVVKDSILLGVVTFESCARLMRG